MKLMATPETIWLPRWVIEAKPWTSAISTEISDRGAQARARPSRMTAAAAAAGEGAGQHLAFEADVENAGALGVEAGEAGEQQRHRDADGRVEQLDDDVENPSQAPVLAAAGIADRARANEANSAWIAGRNMCSSAPANRMTRPWMMTIMSRRDLRHLEGELGAALVEHAEQDRGRARCRPDASGPSAPRRCRRSRRRRRNRARARCWSPMIGLSAIMPASPPEIIMVMMMMRACRDAGIDAPPSGCGPWCASRSRAWCARSAARPARP